MTATVDESTVAGRRRPLVSALVGVLGVTVVLGTGWWWFRGGSFLDAGGGTAIAGARPGVTTNVGLFPRTDGGTVVLEGVDPPRIPGLRIRVVGVLAPPDGGVGLTYGPVAHRVRIRGQRVGATTDPRVAHFQLAVRVTATRPGLYALGDLRVRYRSGLRHRTAVTRGTVLCLAVPGPPPVAPDPRSGSHDPCAGS